MSSLQQQIATLRAEAYKVFPEMDLAVTSILVGFLSRQNTMLYGKPGVAKTALVTALANSFTNAIFFHKAMNKQQPLEDIFGPLSPSKLISQDLFMRNTANRAPEADFILLDEVGRASDTILDSLLELFNEGTFENGGVRQKARRMSGVCTSNSILAGNASGHEAFLDRVLCRVDVQDPVMLESWKYILKMKGSPKLQTAIAVEDLALMQQEVSEVSVPDSIFNLLVNIKDRFMEEGLRISPRRARQTIEALKAYAYLEGESEVLPDHYELVAKTFWDVPKDATVIQKIVLEIAAPKQAEIVALMDDVRSKVTTLGAPPSATAASEIRSLWGTRCTDIQTEINRTSQALREIPGSKSALAIDELGAIESDLRLKLQTMFGFGTGGV